MVFFIIGGSILFILIVVLCICCYYRKKEFALKYHKTVTSVASQPLLPDVKSDPLTMALSMLDKKTDDHKYAGNDEEIGGGGDGTDTDEFALYPSKDVGKPEDLD